MDSSINSYVWAILLSAILALPFAANADGAPELTGKQIFERCGYKYPGEDQQGKFTVILQDKEGKVLKREYLRYWKDYKGADGVADKMLLFTLYPPEAKGSTFMRVAYAQRDKPVDQWIYLPALKKIRRVSIRDPGDSFLNSNLTYADVSQRALEDDDHKYLGTKQEDDSVFYVVESTPKEANPVYGKRIFWFLKTDNWDECVNTRIDYYDNSGELIKDQLIKWQRIGNAWVWDRVVVQSRRTGSRSDFQLSEIKINAGVDDDLFTARSLERGPEITAEQPQNTSPKSKPKDETGKPH
jgi:hypothetical protein